MNSLLLDVPSDSAKRLALFLPLDKIQTIRLASVLMESEYEICFPLAAQSVLEALARYFSIAYRIGTEDAVPLRDVAIAHGPLPESRIGRLSRPLLYPQAVVSRCRDKWLRERSIRFSFSGLVTPDRKRTLESWCRTCLGQEVAITGSGDTYIRRLLRPFSVGRRKKRALAAIGLHLFTSDRGRVFPEKVWDDAYYNTLGDSRFVLCPDGDFIWTYRFFEGVLCGAIPIIEHACPLYDGFEYYTMEDTADRLIWSAKIAERNFAKALSLLTVTVDELNRELARLAPAAPIRR